MRLFEEIAERLGLDEEIVSGDKVILFPGRCVCFENVKSVLSFSPSAVEVSVRCGVLRAEGEGIRAEQYSGGDLVLSGKIVKVEKIR